MLLFNCGCFARAKITFPTVNLWTYVLPDYGSFTGSLYLFFTLMNTFRCGHLIENQLLLLSTGTVDTELP